MERDKEITFFDGRKLLPLGQGTWNMGRNPLKRAREAEALLAGIELGMTMIDTAEMYDNEQFIGRTIRPVRDKVFLVSKVLPSHASYEGTIRACEGSLRRLGTDRIDLYLLHWKGPYPFEQTVEAMGELQQAGKIAMWGVSNIDLEDLERIDSVPCGCTICAADQVLYNLQNRGVEYDLIPWAQANKMPVIAYSPIGEGRLCDHPLLKRIAEKHGATPAQIALAWTIRQPWVMAIPKAADARHVSENFASLHLSLDAEDTRALDTAFPPPARKIPLAGW